MKLAGVSSLRSQPLKRSLVVLLLPLALTLRAAPGAADATDPFKEGVRPTDPLAPEEQAKTFHLPPGFEIQLVAAEPDINKPMNMAFDVTGRLWVTTSIEYPFAAPTNAPGRDRVMIFSDFGPDGRARKVTEFAAGLNIPIGIYPFRSPAGGPLKRPTVETANRNAVAPKTGGGATRQQGNDFTPAWRAIVWSIPHIWLMEDTDGDGRADKREPLYGPFDYTRDTHGNQASFRRGFDGWLYATHGFNNHSIVTGRDGHTVDMQSGNTYRLRLDGSRLEHWTHGQVNPFGLCFDALGNLYSADCHSSPLYQLLRGAFYPSFGKPHDGLGFAPVMVRHSHGSTAISGIVRVEDPAWPAEFQGNFLVGNVMTSRINRDTVEWRGSTPVGIEAEDFASTDDPWFRPVDLQLGPDGALYVADFYNRIIGHYEVPLTHPGRDRERGRIWRIVPPRNMAADVHPRLESANQPRPDGKVSRALTGAATALPQDLEGLLAELGSTNPTRRMLALNELCDVRGDAAIRPLQRLLAGRRAGSFQHALGLWALHRLGALDEHTWVRAVGHKDVLVRVHALRVLAEAREWTPKQVYHALLGTLDDDAHVRRAAAQAIGTRPDVRNLQWLLDLLRSAGEGDTHLRHAARVALRDQLDDPAVFAKVNAPDWSSADLRVIGEVALAVKSEAAALFLMKLGLGLFPDPELRRRVIEHVARYAPVEALDALAETVTKRADVDTDFQLSLFITVQHGFVQRGAALTPAIMKWGTGLAHTLLAGTNAAAWGNTPLDGVRDTRNPWGLQERKCADGQAVRLISSHPRGEQLTGVLRSAPFAPPAKLSFYLCGHDGFPKTPLQRNNFVRLRDAATGEVLREVQPPRDDTARLVEWELDAGQASSLSPDPAARRATRRVFIEVVDANAESAYAWLAFGRFDPPLPELATIDPNQTARWQQAGADLARLLNLKELEPRLVALLKNSGTDFAARAAAAAAVAALRGDGLLAALAGALEEQTVPESVKRTLTTALSGEAESVGDAVATAMQSSPARAQSSLAQKLAANPQGAELLLALGERGKVAPRVLAERVVKDRLAAAKPGEWEARLAKLTASLPPEDEARQRLIETRRAAFDAAKADRANGAAVFLQACAICHQLGGRGALVGPQLDGIGNRGLERVLEDILDPNRNVDHAFRSQIVVLKDGDVISGLVRREEGAVLVMVDSTGREIQVEKAKIESRRESESSLMPDNFGEALAEEQLRDLVAHLLNPGAAEAPGK